MPPASEKQARTGRASKGVGSVLMALVLAGVATAAVLTGVDRITSATRVASRAMRTEVLVARATSAVDTYRYAAEDLPDLAGDPAALRAERAARAEATRLVASIADRSPDGVPLVALQRQLSGAVGRELTLERAGRLAAARRLDTRVADRLAGELFGRLGAAESALARQARRAEADVTHVLAVTVAVRLGVLAAFVLAVETIRRRRLRRRAEADGLRRANDRFAALVAHGTDLFAVVSADGTIRSVTHSAAEALGYDEAALVATPADQLVHPDDRPLFALVCEQGGERVDLRLRGATGTYRSFEVAANRMLDHPEIEGVVLNARDVTDHKLLERELHHQAFHDALTGLPNRALLTDRLEHALGRRSGGDVLAVCLVDLDDFKAINDSRGHRAGDEVLVEVGRRLRAAARQGDTVARFGADAFLILLDDPACGDAAAGIAERLVGALGAPILTREGSFAVKASVGIALPSADGTTADELVRNAEVAMYSAKAAGRGRVAVYATGMHAAVRDRVAAARELEAALDDGGQLEVHYQPIVRVATGEVAAVEALVRWRHPSRGLVFPGEFIPVAEESGLVAALGREVLRQATAQVARWRERHPGLAALGLSVNASPRQLTDPGFQADVTEALAASGLPPDQLVLEITESTFLDSDPSVLERLTGLRALGIRFAIDDFGTGYSSLSYLKRLPVDLVKVDLSFTADLLREGRDGAVARAVVQMGATLGLQTIAEGIEDRRQLDVLRSLSCSLGQGYLFARPMPAADCEALLADARRPVGAR